MRFITVLLPNHIRPHPRPRPGTLPPGGMEVRRWLLAGIGGAIVVLALLSLWDAWTVNVAGILVNRAIVAEAVAAKSPDATAGAQSGLSAAAETADVAAAGDGAFGAQSGAGASKTRADLERAMALMEAAASRGPHTAAREIPIWRTYGAAAGLVPSDRAFELLLLSRNVGRLDRFGELWLGAVASATGHWDVATEAYRRIDASNILIHRAEVSLEAGDKDLAIQQYLLAKASLEAAMDRETATALLLDRTGDRPSVTEQLLRPPEEQVTSLYRIGRGLLNAGRSLEAVTILEQGLEKAKTASPGAVMEQSLTFNLALALARTFPAAPAKPRAASPFTYSYFMDDKVMAYVHAVVRVRGLVQTGLGSGRTAPVCVQAARILLLTGDDEQAVSLYKEAIELDPRLAEAYLGLGAWYEGRGMIILARELYEGGLRRAPGAKPLVDHLAALPGPTESLP